MRNSAKQTTMMEDGNRIMSRVFSCTMMTIESSFPPSDVSMLASGLAIMVMDAAIKNWFTPWKNQFWIMTYSLGNVRYDALC